jgi:hypothetical protein
MKQNPIREAKTDSEKIRNCMNIVETSQRKIAQWVISAKKSHKLTEKGKGLPDKSQLMVPKENAQKGIRQ